MDSRLWNSMNYSVNWSKSMFFVFWYKYGKFHRKSQFHCTLFQDTRQILQQKIYAQDYCRIQLESILFALTLPIEESSNRIKSFFTTEVKGPLRFMRLFLLYNEPLPIFCLFHSFVCFKKCLILWNSRIQALFDKFCLQFVYAKDRLESQTT